MKTFSLLVLIACAIAQSACSNPAKPPEPTQSVSDIAKLTQPATGSDEPLPDDLTLEYRACEVDSDCVLALNGCCDCANGGRDIAVNRARVEAFNARFDCPDGCTERAGNCGRGVITCDDKLCMYDQVTPPRQ